MICLVDGNNFFVSCEQVFDPSLRQKPVVVLSSNDGCIISRSKEAKLLGIKMGQPLFEIKSLLERHNIRIFSSNFELYNDMSKRMMAIIQECVPNVEVYSIDEAFCDFSFMPPKLLGEYGRDLKDKIYKYIGIPCGIGISYTKVLAKIANEIAKKSQKTQGVLALIDDAHIEYALSITKVEDIWGIGRRYSNLLHKNKIYTALQFRDLDPCWVQKHMSIVGAKIQNELKKQQCLNLELLTQSKKSITVSRSFGEPLKQFDHIVSALSHFICSLGRQLRLQQSETDRIVVYLKTSSFCARKKQYHNFCMERIPYYTSNDFDLMKAGMKCLEKIYNKDFTYKKCGIYVSNLRSERDIPSNLFDTRIIDKERNLFKALDTIRDKFGFHSLSVANAMDATWKPKALQKSLGFSTNLDEVIRVK